MVALTIVIAFLILVVLVQTFYLFKISQEMERYKKTMDTEEPVKMRLDKIFENQADVQSSLRNELEKEYRVKVAKLEAKLREAKGLPADAKMSETLKAKGSLKRATKKA